jgi:hypothetical protein
MSRESITYLVAACCGVFGIAAWVALIVAPAWSAYSRLWERAAAVFLSLYVLAGFVAVGAIAGAAFFYYLGDRV